MDRQQGRRYRAARVIGAAVLALALLPGAASAGPGAKVSSSVELARHAARLKAGQWVWAPRIAPQGPVLVYVDLSQQLATVYRNGVRIGVSTISTGKPGHDTPVGVFTILEKNVTHNSNLYDNAPMPYHQRLTWDGVALHAGSLPGKPDSHGCVRLPYGFAKELFGTTKRGTTVIVAGNARHPVTQDDGEVLAPTASGGVVEGDYWAPEKSPSGPVTIVMSRSDQAVAVLRNGVEIGRSHAVIPTNSDATHVLTLAAKAGGAPTWIYVGVSGHDDEDGRPLDEAVRNRVQIPPAFYAQVAPILMPGVTLLVTQSPLAPGGLGDAQPVLDGAR
ncbi:L,D-transpeptidase-like protein [Pseudoduganella flava]|uniref:L,D-transpeptidase family protein n=1 Tax=Pseudoduganella flava TaxID=871742 RepID=A0A562Q165_9BURK|nr:L,D-transpeptidase family protein [Pseudoduganella flava]QGZ38083.1 L,D-transpeptidase family protein [Pseudoduganella flava]TWI50404.1 L,D-transpeptidase-like protein [Pseudoduganella flava]